MNLDVVDATAEALPLELLNKTNKELTAQLTHFEGQLEGQQSSIEDQRKRLQFMKEHLSNVRAEIVNTQSLTESKRREVESEDSMCRVIERECARLKQRKQQLQRALEDTQDNVTTLQDRLFQGNLKVEELKSTMDFNQEELEQWDAARRQKEEDELAIAQYTKEDEIKMKKLTQRIEKLEAQLQRQNQKLSSEVLAAQHVQHELDRVSSEYRKLHHDRGSLLDEWEGVVRTIAERDEAIRIAAEQYAEGAAWIQRRQDLKKSISKELDEAKEETDIINYTIQQREQKVQSLQDVVPSLTQQVQDITDEVEAMREQVSRALRDKRALALQLEDTCASIERRTKELVHTEERRAEAAKHLEDEVIAANDMEKQTNFISQLLQDAQKTSKNLEKDVEQLKGTQFRANQTLSNVRATQTTRFAEIQGAQAQGRNLTAKINQLDSESFAQQGILYNIEFSVQQMEKKVSRAKGERTEEERKELYEKIHLLETTLAELEKQHRVLNDQVKRVREEMRQSSITIERLEATQKRVAEEMLEIELYCAHNERDLKRIEKEREDLLIKSDTLELQLNRLKKLLRDRGAELLSLEERKANLESDIAEREAEVEVHQKLLRMEGKIAEDERRQLSSDLQERQKALTALKNRHDTLVGRMDPAQARLSQAQLVIDAAKEREGLQFRGDSLDSRIKRMEKEMLKLEKTVAIIKSSNSIYKHKFDKVTADDESLQSQQTLKAKYKELRILMNRRALEVNDYAATTRTKQDELLKIQFEKDRATGTFDELHADYDRLTKEVLELRESSIRFDQAIEKTKQRVSPDVVRDIDLVSTRERVEGVVMELLNLARGVGPETYESVYTKLINLQLPIGNAATTS